MRQLHLFIDQDAYDRERERKTRPSRHAGSDDKLACGHKKLPEAGNYRQLPLSLKALIQTVDCPVCQHYLKALAVMKVIKERSKHPVSNTGVNYATTGVHDHDNG